MSELHWDLAEFATRKQLLRETYDFIGEERAAACRGRAESSGVPDKHHANVIEVYRSIDALAVDEAVKQDVRAVYRILAEAEAEVHECEVEHTHFHEVGNASGIRNVIEICLAIREAAPDCITASSAQTGEGVVHCSHGELSIPAPATAAIIARGIPVSEATLPGERMTPTSAAIILHFVDSFI